MNHRIELVKEFLSTYGMDYLWVPVSGGKDSAATWGLVSKATTDYVAVYLHIPGQTHKDNVEGVYRQADTMMVKDKVTVKVSETRRIRETLENALSTCSKPCLLHVLVYDPHGGDYWDAMRRYGFPAPLDRFGRGVRWCCGTFKHRVLERLPYNGVYNGEQWKYGANGVKALDSPYRARKYTNYIQTWAKTRDTYLFPLLDATDEEVWDLLKSMGLYEAVARQYEKWGRSPNCMWCPMLGSKNIQVTVNAMPISLKNHVKTVLEDLKSRYKPSTYSYKSIQSWLRNLDVT